MAITNLGYYYDLVIIPTKIIGKVAGFSQLLGASGLSRNAKLHYRLSER